MRLADMDRALECFTESNITGAVMRRMFDELPTVEPVHAAGGIYCEECKMAVEDGGFLWCRGNEVKPTDFCSHGKQKDDAE